MKTIGRPVFTTQELTMLQGVPPATASQSLSRLAREKMVMRVRRGLWADISSPQFSPFVVINFLLPGHRAYLSFVSALHLYGMISQIPQVITVASTAHSRIIRTPVGTYSLHQIAPSFFTGFDWYRGEGDFLIATPEKALVDCLYLAGRRGRQFAFFPELSIPQGFKKEKIYEWAEKIPYAQIRTNVQKKIKKVLANAIYD